MHIGARSEQDFHRLRVTKPGRPPQRKIVLCMHIGPRSEQQFHHLRMAKIGRIEQTGIQFLLLLWRKVFWLSAKNSHHSFLSAPAKGSKKRKPISFLKLLSSGYEAVSS